MEQQSSFFQQAGQDIPDDLLEKRKGLTFLNWARALELAGNPASLEIGRYGPAGTPYIPLFGGFVVGATLPLPSGKLQTTWLPVTDTANKSVVDAKELTDSINRCRAKALACVDGVGMSLYAGYGGDAQQFVHDLNLAPDSNLAQVAPLTQTRDGRGGQVTYLDWTAALTAARITDPEFCWNVMLFGESPDGYPMLYCPVGASGHALVGVTIQYKGRVHTEYLAITAGGASALAKPTVSDWNRTVMRALAKAIAIGTGYGYGLYSKEEVENSRDIAAREDAEALRLQQRASALLASGQPYPEFADHASDLPASDVLALGKAIQSLLDNPTDERMLAAAAYISGSALSEAGKAQGLLMIEHVRVLRANAPEDADAAVAVEVDPAVSRKTKAKALSALKREAMTLNRLAVAETYVREQHAEHALTDNDLADVLAQLQSHRLALSEQAQAEAVQA